MGKAHRNTEMQEQADLPLTENDDGSVAVSLPDDHPHQDDVLVTEEKSDSAKPAREQHSDKDEPQEAGDDHDEDNESDDTHDDDDKSDDEARLEARREKRRKEKQRRVDRERRAKESDKLKIAALEKQVEELAHHAAKTRDLESSFKLSQTDKKIDDLTTQVEYAKIKLTDAIQAGDALKQAELLDILADLKADLKTAKSIKDEQIKVARQAPEQDRTSNVGRAKQEQNRLATRWMEDQVWFDPQARDLDSKIVKLLDKELSEEGILQSHTQEYWDELTLRCEERLPHHFEKGARMKKTPVTSSRSEAASQPTVKSKREFYLSPQRKEAIIMAGAWDDQIKRQRMIRSYMEFDRQQKQG